MTDISKAEMICFYHDREKRLRYFNEHKRAFDVENWYVLEKFEIFLKNQQHECLIDCGLKINLDIIHAGRFTVGYLPKEGSQQEQIFGAVNFLGEIESRVGTKLNYQLINDFLKEIDFNKVINTFVGVDARPEIASSRIKLFIYIENYPEKMEQAISLCGDRLQIAEIRSLIFDKNLLVGVDLNLDGSTAIEVYPLLVERDLHRADVRKLLGKMLPSKALKLLKTCRMLQIGFSKANDSKVLYFTPIHPNIFVESLGNEMAKKANAYYRHKTIMGLTVAIPELELQKESIQRLNIYYCLS